jgi:hypothetical protein
VSLGTFPALWLVDIATTLPRELATWQAVVLEKCSGTSYIILHERIVATGVACQIVLWTVCLDMATRGDLADEVPDF